MSKLIWEFNLDDDGVKEEFDDAYKGAEWKLVVWDIDNRLRDLLKYDNDYKTPNEALEAIRTELHNIMEGWGVGFD